ncbi:hypothetical protein FZ511_12840 [Salmonella enterica subsp. enterica]|nr:hypothetical protein [Salmonella enterica subsp. enterica serovar Stanley]
MKRFSHYEKKSANLSYQKNQIALKRFNKSGSFCFSTQEKLPVLWQFFEVKHIFSPTDPQ